MEQETKVATPSTQQTMGGSQTSLIIGGILLVLTVVIAGWFWSTMDARDDMGDMDGMMMETMAPAPGTPEEVAASEASTVEATAALTTQGTSDELGSIEADLNATNMGSLGEPAQL